MENVAYIMVFTMGSILSFSTIAFRESPHVEK